MPVRSGWTFSLRAAVATAFLCLALVPRAAAQTPPDPPRVITPLNVEPDVNGVNLATGKINVDVPALSVPAAPRLRFDRVQNAAPYVDGTINIVTGPDYLTSSYSVHTGAQASESFRCTQELGCDSVTRTGSTFLAINTGATGFYQQAPGGEVYDFDLQSSDVAAGGRRTTRAYASSIAYPDGEVITFTYQTHVFNGVTYYRPTRLETNAGYFISISYVSGTFGTTEWSQPAQATLYRTADPATPLQRLTYTHNGSTITITDLGGRTFTLIGVANSLGSNVETYSGSLKLPTEASNTLTINPLGTELVIGSIVRDGVQWNYAYVDLQPSNLNFGDYSYDSITVSGPNGYNVSYGISMAGAQAGAFNYITSRTDALNRTTTFGYDPYYRLTSITLAEGNSIELVYGGNGQIVTRTTNAKPGSGLADIVESASYPGTGVSCTSGVLCWRPESFTDARGNITNYTYNSLGQLTQELAPANASGVRRQTNISYANSASGISRRTLVRVCGGTSCNLNAESRTSYTYFGNTNLPLTVTQTDEATGATRVTTYAYDAAGRTAMIDGPLAGTGDARYFQYDIHGRKVWEVGELAPNNLRLAKKFTYRDSDDRVTKVETGTVACATGCDTASLSLTLLQATDTTYDSRRYPIRERTYKGATNHSVTDRAFLDRGLNDCTTVRMNFASLPAATATGACALGTQGSQGPDRITKNSYDAAGQLLKVQKAYLTADQADYVTYTYTPNGKQQFVTDANNNKAEFRYDGFDRLSHWFFPSKTTPGTVSTSDFEQYGYDANGNRTSLRKRDASTLTFSYDNLNRMTLKVVPSRADLTAAQTRDVYFGYDILGRQLHARFDSGASGSDGITNSYNGFGDLLTSQLKMGSFDKTLYSSYDGAGRRTRLTHPDNQAFTYAYDNISRLSGIYQGTGTGTPLATFGYASNGLVSSRSEGTGVSGASYGWDDFGRLTSQSDTFSGGTNNVAWTFAYNPASQIVTQTRDNDSYGFAKTAASATYTVNGLNQYATVNGAAHSYDANGSLTGTGSAAYTYDIENRLVKAVSGGTTTNLVYDPLGRLFEVNQGSSATTTRFLTDGDAMVAELNSGNSVVNRFVHGSNAAADDPLVWYLGSTLTIKRWLHADHLGSIAAWTNSSGGSPSINRYDEYGVPAGTNIGRFQYTGQAWIGELSLYYYKARFYSPALGRFLQIDPVGYEDNFNLYAYVGNDPVNGADPEGTRTCEVRTGSNICETTATMTISEKVGDETQIYRITYFTRDGSITDVARISEGAGQSMADPTIVLGGIAAGIRTVVSSVLGRGSARAGTQGGAVAISAATKFSRAETAGLRKLMGQGEAGARQFLQQSVTGQITRLPQGVTKETLQRYIVKTIDAGPKTFGAPVHQLRMQAIIKLLERLP